jgi:tartrate dehydrogenase/decarboxylase/D-malate dehydrogenase
VLYEGVRSPLAGKKGGDIDMVIVRENTEGEYAQVGGFVYHNQPDEVAIQTSVFTRRGVERIIRFAFDLAVKRNKKRRVTSITKSNAQGYSLVLWDRAFKAVAADYPNIETESLLVDAAAMNFIRRPESFDVVVGSNLFGDILSDISAILVGSMGLAPSANLDPLRRFPSMFEPVHGSAPDIAGKGIVNPMATILSAGQMLDHLEMPEAGRAIEQAVAKVLREGAVRTADLGGKSSTREVGEAVAAAL